MRLDRLHREAKQKDTSVNALVSQDIRRHVDWHWNAAEASFVIVRRGPLINLIKRLSKTRLQIHSKETMVTAGNKAVGSTKQTCLDEVKFVLATREV